VLEFYSLALVVFSFYIITIFLELSTMKFEASENLLGQMNLECSPLGEPGVNLLSFEKFQVKLKLDTPMENFPI